MAAGGANTLARKTDGPLCCWNRAGQLGVGKLTDVIAPVIMPSTF